MSKPQTIKHVMHTHPLTKVEGVGTFTCNGCKLYGDSVTYRCSDCDYDLHEYCATCPPSLRNSSHGPDHELSMFDNSVYKHVRSCFVCKVYIQGMFYKCNQCSFESHPLCAHAPMHASSPDASITKQRSLHVYPGPGQPSPPHLPYGYHPHMVQTVPYSQGGGNHHPNTSSESPKDGSTPKSKSKRRGMFGVVQAVVATTVTIAGQFAVASMAEGEMTQYQEY